MAVNITADQIVNSNNEAFSFFFTDLQEGQALVFNTANNRWENAFVESSDGADTGTDTTPVVDTGTQTWAQQQAEQLGEATVASELFDATFYGMNSLLFDGTSYLYKDYSAEGNRQTHTLSMWIKKSENIDSSHRYFFDVTQDSANYAQIYFYDNQLIATDYTAGNDGNLHTNSKFRDTNGWYHLVLVNDLTSDTNTLTGSSSDRVRLYVNGVQENSFLGVSVPGQNTTSFINSTHRHIFGKDSNNANAGKEFRGRMANIQFIDGMALDANYFGQNIEGNWAPKSYEGSYGANGFWLDFNDTEFNDSGNLVTVKDVAPIEGAHTTANDWSAA